MSFIVIESRIIRNNTGCIAQARALQKESDLVVQQIKLIACRSEARITNHIQSTRLGTVNASPSIPSIDGSIDV